MAAPTDTTEGITDALRSVKLDASQSHPPPVAHLPLDVIRIILSYLPTRPLLLVLSRVCRSWRKVAFESVRRPPKVHPWSDKNSVIPFMTLLPNLEELPDPPKNDAAMASFWSSIPDSGHRITRARPTRHTAFGAYLAFLSRRASSSLTELTMERSQVSARILDQLSTLTALRTLHTTSHFSPRNNDRRLRLPALTSLSITQWMDDFVRDHAAQLTCLCLVSPTLDPGESISLEQFTRELVKLNLHLPVLTRLAIRVGADPVVHRNVLKRMPALREASVLTKSPLAWDWPEFDALVTEVKASTTTPYMTPKPGLYSLALSDFPAPGAATGIKQTLATYGSALTSLTLCDLRTSPMHGVEWRLPQLQRLELEAADGDQCAPLELFAALVRASSWPFPRLTYVRFGLSDKSTRATEASFVAMLLPLLDVLERRGVEEVCIAGLWCRSEALLTKRRSLHWLEVSFSLPPEDWMTGRFLNN